jgi:hypothetical protein
VTAVTIDPVGRQIGTNIDVGAEAWQVRIAGIADRQHRTGGRVRPAECNKVSRCRCGDDGEVGLDVAGGVSRRQPLEVAPSDEVAKLPRGADDCRYHDRTMPPSTRTIDPVM